MKLLSSLLVLLTLNLCVQSEIPIRYIDYDQTKTTEELTITGRRLEQKGIELKKKRRMLLIEVLLGTPPQSFRLKISSLMQGILIVDYDKSPNFGFNPALSQSFYPKEPLMNGYGEGQRVFDVLSITGIGNISSFPFFLSKRPKFHHNDRYSGYFGLAYNIDKDDKESALCMYDFFTFFKQLIPSYRQLVGFKSEDNDSGVMYVGEYPSEVEQNKKRYKTCQVVTPEKDHAWKCNLNAVYFEDNSLIPINKPVNFSFGANMIIVDKDMYDAIKEKYFGKAIEEKLCKAGRYDPETLQIICMPEFNRSALGVMSLVFGKKTFKLKLGKLFYEEEEQFHFLIIAEDAEEDWHISFSQLIDAYVFFDKENKEIGYYLESSK